MAPKLPREATIVRSDFAALVTEVKGRIQAAQTRAMLAVNAELVHLYWDIGRIIDERQKREGWGAAVIPRLAKELKNELPAVKGFSAHNIGRMIAFYREYSEPAAISPQPAAKLSAPGNLPPPSAKLPSAPGAALGTANCGRNRGGIGQAGTTASETDWAGGER
jgi:hypothetical protein